MRQKIPLRCMDKNYKFDELKGGDLSATYPPPPPPPPAPNSTVVTNN